jgi:hypothetical protein
MDYVESRIPSWMLTEKGAELARQEIARTRALYATGQADDNEP